MAAQRRAFQVAGKIREIIASELMTTADPRFTLVTVTSVMTSGDMRHAKIYWTVTGGRDRIEEVSEAFRSAAGMFRRVLASRLGIRFVPEIRFYYDDTCDTSDEVARLLARVNEKTPEDGQ